MYGYQNRQQNFHNSPYANGLVHTGADPAAPPTTLDNLKAFMTKTTMGVQNQYLIGGALVLGVGYYGYTKGWF